MMMMMMMMVQTRTSDSLPAAERGQRGSADEGKNHERSRPGRSRS